MPVVDVSADIVADSSTSTGLRAFYAAGTSMVATSGASANAKEAERLHLAALANSLLGATLSSAEHPLASMLGSSIFFIDPSKITVVHFVKQTSVPRVVPVVQIPKLSITSPEPPAPGMLLSTAKRSQRRQ